jgi:uncharacterized protein (TIGR03083 family)
MNSDGHIDDLVGPYVLEACSPGELQSLAEHASGCPTCAAEIAKLSRAADWIGVASAKAPAPDLRSRVLSAAIAARAVGQSTLGPDSGADHATLNTGQALRSGQVGDAADGEVHRLLEPYREQVDDLNQLLSELSQPQWLRPTGPHRTVRDLVLHLCGNDGLVAVAAGVEPPILDDLRSTTDVRLGWRGQVDAIIDAVAGRGPQLLWRQVDLAGRTATRGQMREALIQRGYETWIHAEDIRATLRLPPQTPSAQQVSDIVNFALRLLPAAMDAAGRAHPAKAIRLVLTGAGGSTRLVNLSATSPTPATVVAEVCLPAERLCRLLAGRPDASSTTVDIEGDSSVATDFLTVAATMGCD